MKNFRQIILFSGFALSSIGVQALEEPEYCASNGLYSNTEWIESVAINGEEFVSGQNGGYHAHPGIVGMHSGDNSLSVNPGYGGSAYVEHWRAWIDLNSDGIFEEEEVLFEFSGNTSNDVDVHIPDGTEGTSKLRIAMKWGGYPEPCGSYTYGETEDFTVFIEGEGEDGPDLPYHLVADYDFEVQRNGSIGDTVVWVVEKDGAIVLKRNAKSELAFQYWNNTHGSDIRIWLEQYIAGSYERVSNVIEYTPGITDKIQLNIGEGYELSRTGWYGESVQWVIEEDGEIVLERNATDEFVYTYLGNTDGSKYRAWVQQFIDGEYQVVSNTIEYEVGQGQFTLTVDQLFGLSRNGQLGDSVQWVVEKDGAIVLQRNAANELEYTYYNNSPGSSFRVWLQMFVDGAYEVVSNVVVYDVPSSYPYTVTLGSNYEVMRSGSLGDNVVWVVIKDGSQALKRSAGNELSYTYYSNTPGSVIQVYLEEFIDGYYQPVSNMVQYTVQ
ncbi:GEVED domain-containing protein [Gilvimarinus sp. F26214L]|uniref:GEVED domain-containing protein n=1 Tax=Gilvimarinus sp. DZF01 TaxID=3461371 RepID=UPI004045F179